MYKKEILFTNHARKRMSQRLISTDQVLDCLQFGELDFAPTTGHYRYTYKDIQVIIDVNRFDKFTMDIITVTYKSEVNNIIFNIAQYYNINHRQATKVYKEIV